MLPPAAPGRVVDLEMGGCYAWTVFNSLLFCAMGLRNLVRYLPDILGHINASTRYVLSLGTNSHFPPQRFRYDNYQRSRELYGVAELINNSLTPDSGVYNSHQWVGLSWKSTSVSPTYRYRGTWALVCLILPNLTIFPVKRVGDRFFALAWWIS